MMLTTKTTNEEEEVVRLDVYRTFSDEGDEREQIQSTDDIGHMWADHHSNQLTWLVLKRNMKHVAAWAMGVYWRTQVGLDSRF